MSSETKVDVRGVMRSAAFELRTVTTGNEGLVANQLDVACAAVAELIEKAHAAQADLRAMIAAADRGEVWVVSSANRLRDENLAVALASVGGNQ